MNFPPLPLSPGSRTHHLTITYVPDEKCVETKSLKILPGTPTATTGLQRTKIVNRITDDLALPSPAVAE